MYIVSQPGDKRHFEKHIRIGIFSLEKESDCIKCLTCVCAVSQGDVITDRVASR